jgi:hypothetical protein
MMSNGAPPHMRNGSSSGNGVLREGSFRHMSTGSLNIPIGMPPHNGSGGQPQMMGPMLPSQRLDGPRSPPNKQSEFAEQEAQHDASEADVDYLQTPLMSHASSSVKGRVRLERRAHSAMI